jgi:VCBS repeat-containing protein
MNLHLIGAPSFRGPPHLDALLANTDNKAALYLNSAEPWDADTAPNNVVEYSPAGTPVGITIRTRNTSATERIAYRLLDDAGGRFMVDSSTGIVTVKNGGLLNTQQPTKHSILAAAESSERGTFLRSFSVSVVSPYQPLQARPDAYSTRDGVELIVTAGAGLLANDILDSTATATVSSSDERSLLGIRVVVEPEGAIRYDAVQQAILRAIPQGASLEDRFQYTATSSRQESSAATVTITVTGVNDAPQAASDTLELLEGGAAIDITQLLLDNDTDPDTNGKDTMRVQSLQASSTQGIVELRGGRVWYQPGAAFHPLMIGETGEDRFQYTIEDEHGATSVAAVTVRVRGTSSRPSDLNGDDTVDLADLEELCLAVRTGSREARFDVSQDGLVGDTDVDLYLSSTLRTTYGDANLDSAFDSSDLVLAFQSGRYEDSTPGDATWSAGDWNCDGQFNSSDLVRAFQAGDYTQNNVIHVRSGTALDCDQADRFCSLQKAVDAAGPGDTILVWPGTYAPFTVRGSRMAIRAIDRDAAEVIIDGDLSSEAASDGVTLLGEQIQLEGFTATDSVIGFRVEGAANVLLRNTARDNLSGFRIAGRANLLERNRAIANARDGFFVSVESVESIVAHNDAQGNGRYGYWLAGKGDVVSHNRAAGNMAGFLLAGGPLGLQNNEASTNRQAGFLLETGGHTLTSNLSRSNVLDGFWAMPSASRNRYDANQATGNGRAGFRLESSFEMMVGNESTANGTEGFLLTGASHAISANTAADNGSHGFSVLMAGSRLYRNMARKNGGWGFRLQTVGNTLVENSGVENRIGEIGWE